MTLERLEIIRREGVAADLQSLIHFEPREVYTRVLVKYEKFSATLICLPAGSSIDTHVSLANACIQVVQGRGVCQSGGKEIPLREGSFVFTPPHVENSVKAEEDLAFLLCLAH
jgi:quercetin dioxygenase-like cupin family protein